jgi:uncharacterized damage-inducible protein DinB
MRLADTILPEFDQEMATTRRVLERVPEDQLGWRPHERSTTLGGLASHLAQLAGMGTNVFTGTSLDLAPPGAPPRTPTLHGSRQEILDAFDANVKRSRQAIEQADDAAMRETWSLLRGGQTIFALPRIGVVRTMLLSHSIHHRGQLTVYLRLTGAPVPAIYGPSADERGV